MHTSMLCDGFGCCENNLFYHCISQPQAVHNEELHQFPDKSTGFKIIQAIAKWILAFQTSLQYVTKGQNQKCKSSKLNPIPCPRPCTSVLPPVCSGTKFIQKLQFVLCWFVVSCTDCRDVVTPPRTQPTSFPDIDPTSKELFQSNLARVRIAARASPATKDFPYFDCIFPGIPGGELKSRAIRFA